MDTDHANTKEVVKDGSTCPSSSIGSNNSSPKKVKGILKHTEHHQDASEVKWDEMNILETYHPANKDYGHMKIDEPPTPYNHEYDEEMDEGGSNLNPDDVADKLTTMNPRKDHFSSGEDNDEDEEKYLSEKARAKKKEFRQHRKQHYDEGLNIKKARELIAKEMAELEAEENAEMETEK